MLYKPALFVLAKFRCCRSIHHLVLMILKHQRMYDILIDVEENVPQSTYKDSDSLNVELQPTILIAAMSFLGQHMHTVPKIQKIEETLQTMPMGFHLALT